MDTAKTTPTTFPTDELAPMEMKIAYDTDNPLAERCSEQQGIFLRKANANEIRRFYRELMKMPWLSARMRRAIKAELSGSVREHNRQVRHDVNSTLRLMINETETRLRKQRKKGIHDAAVADIAERFGIEPETLKKGSNAIRGQVFKAVFYISPEMPSLPT